MGRIVAYRLGAYVVDYQNTEDAEIWRWESEGGCTGVEIRDVVRTKRARPAVTLYKAIDWEVATMPRCQWPIGDPTESNFRFCQAEALAKRPYCAEHSALAYTPARRISSVGL